MGSVLRAKNFFILTFKRSQIFFEEGLWTFFRFLVGFQIFFPYKFQSRGFLRTPTWIHPWEWGQSWKTASESKLSLTARCRIFWKMSLSMTVAVNGSCFYALVPAFSILNEVYKIRILFEKKISLKILRQRGGVVVVSKSLLFEDVLYERPLFKTELLIL